MNEEKKNWQIKDVCGIVLYEGEFVSLEEAVEAAVEQGAKIQGANLQWANLQGAKLQWANLQDAFLQRANLQGAKLQWANLQDADLRVANLQDADLQGANLQDADLQGANLQGAKLQWANLQGADLRGANLQGAFLETGETYETYISEVLPALLTAGGKTLSSFEEHWQCHDWENCPMAHAFDCKIISGVPVILRPRAEQFVILYDGYLLPWSVVKDAIKAREVPLDRGDAV